MSQDRFVSVLYCDDVRHEVGNKLSFIGCYTGELIVTNLPVVLPKLAAMIRVTTPISRPIASLKIRALLDDVVIGEIAQAGKSLSAPANNVPDATKQVVMALMVFSPIEIERESKLRIEVEADSDSLQGDVLRMRMRRENEPVPISLPG